MPRAKGPKFSPAAFTGGHPLAQAVRDEMTRRRLTVSDVHRMTTGISYSSVYFFVTAGQPVSDRVARTIAEALGLRLPPPPHTTEDTMYTTSAPTKSDTDAERQRDNLSPHLRWLTLLAEAIDDGAELGDVRPDLERAVRDVLPGLQVLLREVGSTLQVRVGR